LAEAGCCQAESQAETSAEGTDGYVSFVGVQESSLRASSPVSKEPKPSGSSDGGIEMLGGVGTGEDVLDLVVVQPTSVSIGGGIDIREAGTGLVLNGSTSNLVGPASGDGTGCNEEERTSSLSIDKGVGGFVSESFPNAILSKLDGRGFHRDAVSVVVQITSAARSVGPHSETGSFGHDGVDRSSSWSACKAETDGAAQVGLGSGREDFAESAQAFAQGFSITKTRMMIPLP